MFKTNLGTIELKDLIEIQIIQGKSKLPQEKGYVKPTLGFLKGVADYLEGVLFKKVSSTQALQIWYGASIVQNHLADKNKLHSDVGHWYGVNPFDLTSDELTSLHGNLPRVKAQQRIERGDYDQTCVVTAYEIHMLAYDDEDRALRARSAAAKLKSQTPTGTG
tara:strand:- start:2193 stop:2681 length:489 start_codon:yes stop_codon:yes gene_type:complete